MRIIDFAKLAVAAMAVLTAAGVSAATSGTPTEVSAPQATAAAAAAPLKASDLISSQAFENEIFGAYEVWSYKLDAAELKKAGFTKMKNGKWVRNDVSLWQEAADPEEEDYTPPVVIMFKSVDAAKAFMRTLDAFDWQSRGSVDRQSSSDFDNALVVVRNGMTVKISNE